MRIFLFFIVCTVPSTPQDSPKVCRQLVKNMLSRLSYVEVFCHQQRHLGVQNLINHIYGSNSMPCKVINSQKLTFAILKYQSGQILLPCHSCYKLFSGEEPPESLFMKELKRRGMNSSTLREESNRSISGDEEIRFKEEDGGFTNRNAVSTDVEKGLSNQRERSMALNSEGLEVGKFSFIIIFMDFFFAQRFWL